MFNFNKTLSFPFFPIGKLKNKPNENNTMMFLHHTYIKHHILFHNEIKTLNQFSSQVYNSSFCFILQYNIVLNSLQTYCQFILQQCYVYLTKTTYFFALSPVNIHIQQIVFTTITINQQYCPLIFTWQQ